jgi:hypothetical protein
MAAELATLATNAVCDVFLSHAGEQKKSFVDCVYQLLTHVGGRGWQRSHRINVFLDQHSLKPGNPAWAVMDEKAATCRIGTFSGCSQRCVRHRLPTCARLVRFARLLLCNADSFATA